MPDDVSLFDRRISLPDRDAQRRFSRLVGMDDVKDRLLKLLAVIVHPGGLAQWRQKHHPDAVTLIDLLESRPPLVIMTGDVGTGKTTLAETIGDAVARQENIPLTLLPLSLATRGSGRVGEMTQLLSAAFEETASTASRYLRKDHESSGAVILMVDEGDALAQSREASQMHHEDRAGVNAFIRGVDRLAQQKLPAAVILCTNRLSAIDPAVQRRAAEIFAFERPDAAQRYTVLAASLEEIGFSELQIQDLADRTGALDGRPYGWTYSDLTQRLLPLLVLDAYPEGPIRFERARELLKTLQPTPPFARSQ